MKELDFSKPELLQTRGGYDWRLHATDINNGSNPILISVFNCNRWNVVYLAKDGRQSSSVATVFDLIPKPQRVTGWGNTYASGMYANGMSFGGKIFPTQAEAKKGAGPGCIGQIYIDAEVQQ